jgi:4-aminobutyrate aminotransferase-like enzyme
MALFDITIDELEDVIAIRTQAMQVLKDGGTVLTSWSSEGTSVTLFQGLPVTKIIEECNLYIRAHAAGKRIRRLTPRFNG